MVPPKSLYVSSFLGHLYLFFLQTTWKYIISAIAWDVKPNIHPMELYLSGCSPASNSLSTRKELCYKWEECTLSNFMPYHALGPLHLLVLETHNVNTQCFLQHPCGLSRDRCHPIHHLPVPSFLVDWNFSFSTWYYKGFRAYDLRWINYGACVFSRGEGQYATY